MKKFNTGAIIQNKFLWAVIITVLVLSIISGVSIERFLGVNNFTGSMISSANLGIRNILLDRFSSNPVPNKNIVMVAIDNKTLSDETGLWRFQDFKRSYYAKLIDNLKRDGAVVIGIDVLFSERSNDDTELAESIAKAGNVILGFSLKENLFPLAIFKSGATNIGYFHPSINPVNNVVYGVVPAMKDDDGHSYEAFSVAIVRSYLNKITGQERNLITPTIAYFDQLKAYQLFDTTLIPYASKDSNEAYVNYLRKGSDFQTISFSDVYNGNYDPNTVKDRIVLIGSRATALFDKFNTPLGIQDGVLIHANMVNTILNRSYIVEVEKGTEIAILILLTFLLSLFILHVNSRFYQLAFSFLGLTLTVTFQIFYFSLFHKLFHYPLQFLLIVFFVAIFATGYKYFYEEKGKRLLKSTLSQYLSEDLVVNVLEKYEEVKLGGERKEVTTFFSDIAGFTSISENMEPEELVRFLSIYLKEVSDIIMHHRGFINKYEWDAVMALWWAFGKEPNKAELACRAALEQQKKIHSLNEEFQKNHGFSIQVRMGINTGPAVVGNIGSSGKKIEYTALGDSVNTASRFEGINKVYETLICVGESTVEQAKEHFVFRKLDSLQVKGKEKPVTIYELIGPKNEVNGETIGMIQKFEEGLNLYFEWKFSEAETIFSHLVETKNDRPSSVFQKRCETLKSRNSEEKWTWVYRATEK